jgi:hypothetical protein
MRLSALQMIYDLAAFATKKEKTSGALSAAQLAQLYKENMNITDRAEDTPTSKNFIDTAMAVHKRLLSIPACQALLVEADDRLGTDNPLDSVEKLYAILRKGQTAENLTWTIGLIFDWHFSGALTTDQVGVRALDGSSAAAGGKGLQLDVTKANCLSMQTPSLRLCFVFKFVVLAFLFLPEGGGEGRDAGLACTTCLNVSATSTPEVLWTCAY